MKRIFGATLAMALAAGALACSDKSPSGPDNSIVETPPGMVVSNALGGAIGLSVEGVSRSISVAVDSVAYLSAAPGTFPGAVSVEISNSTRPAAPITRFVIEGGFDPVGIEAHSGDELSLNVSRLTGGSSVIPVKVPPRRPPAVVRTTPAKGRTDVALNIQVVVIFSEPIEASSVTSSSFTLRRGETPVIGRIQVSADRLTAELIPDSELAPQATYTLTVSGGIRDLDGDALSETSVFTFATIAATATIAQGQIVFVEREATGYGIFVANADGVRVRRISPQGALDIDPAVSRDGKRVAYSSALPMGNFDLYVMNADGSNRVPLTKSSPSGDERPTWSPDGGRIAFVRRSARPQIYVINADGTGLVQLTNANGNNGAPEWSPDGRRILFDRDVAGWENKGIFSMNPDGTDARQLTSGHLDRKPTWSPDGMRIAFIRQFDHGGKALFMANADGSDAKQLTFGITTVSDPTWSPDGKSIAFGFVSASRICVDVEYGTGLSFPCGDDVVRVSLEGVIDPVWLLSSATNAAWQR